MDNVVSVDYGDEAITTKEELVSRLSQRLAKAQRKLAFCESKIERKDSNYMGDVYGDRDAAIAESQVYREALDKILAKF